MEIGTFTPDNLLAGDFYRVTDWLTIPSGKLARGTIIKADGTAMASGDVPCAVLAESVDATGAEVQAPVYLTGEFTKEYLLLADGSSVSAADDIAALRALSIFAKESISAA